MYNELTKTDIQKMQEELDYRCTTLRSKLLEEVKAARAFVENMIKTAVIIEDRSGADTAGLYDKVTIWVEDEEEEETWQVVTTVRQDINRGRISKESPVGAALLGTRVGDRVRVQVNKEFGYFVQIRAIEKQEDDGSAELNTY